MPPEKNALSHEEIRRIVEILTTHAMEYEDGVEIYFKKIIKDATLPKPFKTERQSGWKADPEYNARALVDWAISKGGNYEDTRYTTLGTVLDTVLSRLGVEDGRWIAALIVARHLYRDDALINDIAVRYRIPLFTEGKAEAAVDIGPDIDWQGPTDQVKLQSWFAPQPDFEDVGFLTRAIQRASSVCRIEFRNSKRQGTGFLIGKTLVLTNFHVLKGQPEEDIVKNARDAVLRFGVITTGSGEEAKGIGFKLAAKEPVLKWSPDNQLDYALLRVEDSIQSHQADEHRQIEPAPFTMDIPSEKTGLHILGHPEHESMKLSRSADGVVKVLADKGLVQYVTKARRGSSGSPCFTDNWEVIALHHAERSRPFGTIREGIIFRSIHKEIKKWL